MNESKQAIGLQIIDVVGHSKDILKWVYGIEVKDDTDIRECLSEKEIQRLVHLTHRFAKTFYSNPVPFNDEESFQNYDRETRLKMFGESLVEL